MRSFLRRDARAPFAYAAALALPGLALALSKLSFAAESPLFALLLFTPLVIGIGAVGGAGPTLLAGVLTILSTDYFFIPTAGTWKLPYNSTDAVALLAVAAATLLTASLARVTRRLSLDGARAVAMATQLREAKRRGEALLELGARAVLGGDVYALCREATAMSASILDVQHCVVLEVGANDSLTITAATGWDPTPIEGLTLPADAASQAGYALHAREPVVVTDADSEIRFSLPAALRARGVRSGIAARIAGAGRPFGVVVAYCTTPRTYGPEDSRFMTGVALVLAGMFERRRLEGERAELAAHDAAARAQAELAARRTAFLAQTATVLDASMEPETTLVTLARLAVPGLADCAVVDLVQEEGHIRRVDVVDIDPVRREVAQTIRRIAPNLRGEGPVARAIRTGQSALLSEVPDGKFGSMPDPEDRRLMRTLQCHSLLLMPLVARGQTLGLITLASRTPDRRYGTEDLSVARELAARAAIALDNARLYREAEAASRAKDDFLATVSHELRTPINAVLGWATMLREQRFDQSRVEHAYKAIERSARAQAQLLEQLLDVSRIVSGKIELHLAPVGAAGIIEAAIDAVQPAADDRKVRITSRIDPSLLPLMADAERLQQVMINLIANAVKFSPEDGLVEIDARMDNGYAVVAVSDQGVGISREFLPYVFDRFRQAEGTTGSPNRGLGLGLAIVRDIVERHAGTVTAESAGEGKGSRFTVRLPVRPTTEHATYAIAGMPSGSRGERA